MEFCKKVAKGFKKVDVNLIDAGALKEAQVLDKKIRAARSELRKQILSIFLPILPTYVAGVFLRVCIRSVHGFVWGYEAQIEAAAAADNPDRNACFSMMFVWFVLVTVLQPFEKLAGMLVKKTSNKFELQLRKVVLKCLLSQDRVYFDRHNTGELHGKLGRCRGSGVQSARGQRHPRERGLPCPTRAAAEPRHSEPRQRAQASRGSCSKRAAAALGTARRGSPSRLSGALPRRRGAEAARPHRAARAKPCRGAPPAPWTSKRR